VGDLFVILEPKGTFRSIILFFYICVNSEEKQKTINLPNKPSAATGLVDIISPKELIPTEFWFAVPGSVVPIGPYKKGFWKSQQNDFSLIVVAF